MLCICTVCGTAKTVFDITMSTDNLNSWHTKVLRVTLATSGSFKTLFMTSTFQIKLSFPLILTRLSEFKTRPDCDEWQHCIQSSQRSQWKLYSIRKQQGRVPQSLSPPGPKTAYDIEPEGRGSNSSLDNPLDKLHKRQTRLMRVRY